MELTIILPCAGEGSRLGLKSPKELFEIVPGKRLIDFSLEHILAYWGKPGASTVPVNLKVAVVIRPWKEEVVEYVAGRLPGLTVERVLFDDTYFEWPGSVYSASRSFSRKNLVLLPDSCLRLGESESGSGDISAKKPNSRGGSVFNENGPSFCRDSKGDTLVELVSRALDSFEVVFGSVPCNDPARLAKLGAMWVEGNVVTAFQDKPVENRDVYNSFWGCYAFRETRAQALYDFLVSSVKHQPVTLRDCLFNPPGAVSLHTYRDLGTWKSIEEFRKKSRRGSNSHFKKVKD
ncbi:MAG: hypothetical protein GY757_53485 [bacterium]|nr:hypothetical protein [bacterium]